MKTIVVSFNWYLTIFDFNQMLFDYFEPMLESLFYSQSSAAIQDTMLRPLLIKHEWLNAQPMKILTKFATGGAQAQQARSEINGESLNLSAPAL